MRQGDLSALWPALSRAAAGELTDAELLGRWRGTRDAAAFEVLAWRYGPLVLGTCRRILRNAHDAEDAFQAVFLILARKAASIAKPELLGSWLHQAARRVALRLRSTLAKKAARTETDMEDLKIDEVPTDDTLNALDDELQRLPEHLRLPLTLRYLAGMPNRQVAERLGCCENTVCSRLARGRERLRERLRSRGLLSLGAGLSILESAIGAVPRPLVASATRLATSPAARAASPHLVSLSEGAMRMLFWSKLKIAMIPAFLCLAVGGAILLADAKAQPARPAEEKPPPDAGGWKLKATPLETRRAATTAALSPDGKRLATASRDHSVRLWDVAAGKELATLLKGHPDPVEALAFSPDGKRLAAGCGSLALVWDMPEGALRHVVHTPVEGNNRAGNVPREVVTALAFSADGDSLALGCDAQTNWMHFAKLGGKEKEIRPAGSEEFRSAFHEGPVEPKAVAFCPKSKLAVVVGDSPLILKNRGDFPALILVDPAEDRRADGDLLPDHDAALESAVFTPDGKRLIVGSADKLVLVYDVAKRKRLAKLRGHEGAVTALAVSADGKMLASAGVDKSIRLWDLAKEKQLAVLDGHAKPVLRLQFDADGRLVSADAGGVVKVWEKQH